MDTLQAPAKRKRSAPKKDIYDWEDLVAAIKNPPPAIEGEVAEVTRERAAGMHQWAQITDRLVAHTRPDRICLSWLTTPRGSLVADSQLLSCVSVYPAAGGRTTYAIDESVDGWFANKHLPMNARDRSTRSQYKQTRWFFGQSGVYQKGTGPYYPDVGPDMHAENVGLEHFCQQVQSLQTVPAAWVEQAVAFCQRVAAAVAPFPDVRLRFESSFPDGDDPMRPAMHVASSKYGGLPFSYGLRVRLKSPMVSADGASGAYRAVPDFSAFVVGPDVFTEGSRPVQYGAELLLPTGRRHTHAWTGRADYSTGLQYLLCPKPAAVIEAARQWAASRIYIPCS